MIDVLWNAPSASEASYVICADWRAMPIGSRNIDLVLGDGCNAALSFPDGLRAVMGEVARVLRPGGLFLLRAFVRPEPGETVEDIARDLASGRIGSVHVLKWRLFAALCNDVQIGVRLGDVWDAWNSMRALATFRSTENGWTAAEISTIDVYRGDKETRFYFASLAELRALTFQYFVERQCIFGQYELGDRCPIMVLAKPAA
jgi:SAM-dependent methyltransferase